MSLLAVLNGLEHLLPSFGVSVPRGAGVEAAQEAYLSLQAAIDCPDEQRTD